MNLDEVQMPEKPAALIEAERRHSEIARKRRTLDEKLQNLQAELNRRALGLDDAATVNRLVSGELESLDGEKLPQEAAAISRELKLYREAERELVQRLAKLREKFAGEIARAYRPIHQLAVARIWEALQALAEANQFEEFIHLAVPRIRLPHLGFPNVGKLGAGGGSAQHWKNHVKGLGYLAEPDEPPAEPRANRPLRRHRRKASKSNGVDKTEAAPMVAASSED